MSDILIRRGKREDVEAAHALVHELAIYEKASEEHTCTLEQFTKDGFGDSPAYELLVAVHQDIVVGIGLFYTAYSTWKGKYIYLDDLIVTEEMRGQGIGAKLLEKLFEIAKERQVPKISWQVLDWNEPAINFYKKYPVEFDGEWVNCQISKSKL